MTEEFPDKVTRVDAEDEQPPSRQLLKITGCSIEKNGLIVRHDLGHQTIPWDSITYAFAVGLKTKGSQSIYFFIISIQENENFLYIDSDTLSTMKLLIDGSVSIKKIRLSIQTYDEIDSEFKEIVSKICGRFSWTFIDLPLRRLVNGETVSLPVFATHEEIARHCEDSIAKVSIVSGDKGKEEALKEIKNLTGPLVQREEWTVGAIKENRYVIEEIFQGGMGFVYVALDNTQTKYYAIKTYQDQFLFDDMVISQFIREAEIWVNLGKHRNIVQAEMVKLIDGRPYIFLEYIQGTDLEEKLQEGLLPVKTTLDYALQFCCGMDYAYQSMGLVHRDIKPSNCFITRENILKISDFGLGKIVAESRRGAYAGGYLKGDDSLSSGAMVGTVPYMAPEIFSGTSGNIKTDIYAFGVMFYTMLTGTNPFFDEDPTEIIERHMMLMPDDPATINPEVPQGIRPVVDRCLEKEPGDRYGSFSEIYDDLKKIYRSFTGEDYAEKIEQDTFSEQDWIKKGVSLASLNHHKEALINFNEALKLNPRSPARLHKGISLSALSFFDEALRSYDEFLKIFPDNWKIWYHRGETLRLKGNYKESLECLTKALQMTTQQGLIIGQIGKLLEDQNRVPEALEYYDKALSQNEKMAEVWDNKGCLLMGMNRFEAAQECFSEATEINPRFQEAWYHRAIALQELGFFQEAIKYHNLALSLKYESVPSLAGLGDCHRELHNYKRAIDFYNKALLLEPANFAVQLGMLRAQIADSQYEEAYEYVSRILETNPDNTLLLTELLQTFYELGYYSESLELCRDLMKKDRDNWRLSLLSRCARLWIDERDRLFEDIVNCPHMAEEEIWSDINSILCVTCNIEEAIRILRYRQNNASREKIDYLLALLYSITGANEEALEAIERALSAGESPMAMKLREEILREIDLRQDHSEERPREGLEWMIIAMRRLHEGRSQDALNSFQKALNLDSNLDSCWYFAGKAFENLGNHDDSKRYFNNFIQCYPRSAGFYREQIFTSSETMKPDALDMAYKRWIGYLPQDHSSWIAYIRYLLMMGYDEKARLLAVEIVKTYLDTWFISGESAEFLHIFGLLQLFLKRYKSARSTFQGIVKNNPEYLPGKLALAKTLELTGDCHEAEKLYKSLIESGDISMMTLYQLSGLYLKTDSEDRGLNCIHQALEIRDDVSELLYRKAEILLKLKEFPTAVEVTYKLAERDKKFFPAHILHSRILDRQGKTSGDLLTRALPANPKNANLLKALAMVHIKLKDYVKALATLDLVISWNKTDVESVMAQGIAYYRTGSYEKALKSYQNAAEINYKNPDIWIYLASTHFHLGNDKISEALFNQALLIDNTYTAALVNLGIFLFDQGRIVEAQQYAEKALRIDPEYGPAWFCRARCCRAYGNVEEGKKSIESAFATLSSDLRALILRGIIAFESGDTMLSMQSFKNASELAPEDPVPWYDLAVTALKEDKIDHAFKWTGSALLIHEDFFEALFLKGVILFKLEKDSKAQEAFKQAAALDPEKFERNRRIQVAQSNLLAPVRHLEHSGDPFFLPYAIDIPLHDPFNIFDLEKPEEALPLVKDLSKQY